MRSEDIEGQVFKRALAPLDEEQERIYNKVIGQNLRAIRMHRLLTQRDIASFLGVSFQQIQKYESGVNRLTLGRAIHLAGRLGVELYAFIDGVDGIETIDTTNRRELTLHQCKLVAEVSDLSLCLPPVALDGLLVLLRELLKIKNSIS